MSILDLMKKPVGDVFAPRAPGGRGGSDAVQIGSLSNVRKSAGEDIDKANPLAREDRTLHRQKLNDWRYAKTADELLATLAKTDPDVSAGIWNYLRLANSGLRCLGINEKMQPDAKVQERLDMILARFSGVLNFADWDLYRPVEQTANQLLKYILLRGGVGLELVLGNGRTAQKLLVVDPITVEFKHVKLGVYKPVQKKKDGSEVKLDIPNFFWGLLDPDADSPYETPPFLPVIQAVLFNISVMQDLERIVKRTAYPRISVKIVEETLRKFAPVEIQADPIKMAKWLGSQKADISNSLKDLAPEDAAVFFDSLEIDILETKTNPSVDFRPLKEVIDQRIIAGLKSLPTILGRQFGSSQTIGGVESLLYAKSIVSLQQIVAHMLTRALTLALRLEGVRGFARVIYNDVSLKPDNELEAFKSLKQARILERLSLGIITDEEASQDLTGSPFLPAGYKRLSGTGFYKGNPSGDAAAVASTRNPTAEETAGGGRQTA